MFGQIVKNITYKQLFLNSQGYHKILQRNFLKSQSQLTAQSSKDIIVKSPLPSVKYPEWTIDQYVWNDINNWSNKTALVRFQE